MTYIVTYVCMYVLWIVTIDTLVTTLATSFKTTIIAVVSSFFLFVPECNLPVLLLSDGFNVI